MLIVKCLVCTAIQNLNHFPVENGISDEFSPLAIVAKTPPPDHANFDIDFGVHEEVLQESATLSNPNRPISLPMACACQTSFRKPSKCFMHLVSVRRIRRAQYEQLKIPNEATVIVYYIGRYQKES